MKLRIGIFDSGIGGFTILKSLLKSREDVEILYLADTKRVPYGDKNYDQIRNIALEICGWFEDKQLDALLIGCNTTNACALDILEEHLKVPCFDLINSVSEIISKKYIGVLATSATIESSYYKKLIELNKVNVKVFQQACPEFVSEIEKDKIDFNRIDYLSELYLRPLLGKNIQEIILGCSHYPLIYEILKKKIDSSIKIIDPSTALISKFNKFFQTPKIDCYETISYENVNFFVTANNRVFSQKVKYWLEINKEISLVNLRSND